MPARLALFALALTFTLTGCQRDEVTAYRVPKETSPSIPGVNAPAETATAAATGGLVWNAPDHWIDQGTTSMRKGNYRIESVAGAVADLSVISFPGDVGGMAANVNRWRGQVGLAPISPAQVDAGIEHTDTAFFHIDIVSMTGEIDGAPTRIDGGIFTFGGETWFVKFMGPADLVADENENFRAFLKTIAPAQN